MLGELGGASRGTVLGQVRRTRTDHVAHGCEPSGDQGGILEYRDAYRQVEPFGQQVYLPVVEVQVELDPRVGPQEGVDGRPQVVQPERERHGHPQPSLQIAVLLGHRQLGLLDIGEDAQATLVETPSGVRQVESASGAAKQLDGQASFKIRQPAADGGLGDFQALRRPCDAACLHDTDKGAHLFQSVHCSR
jgi:hypothetical protein